MPEIKLLGCMSLLYCLPCVLLYSQQTYKTQIGLLISRFLFPHFMSRDITIFKHVIMHGIFMPRSYQIQKGYMFYGFARVWVDRNNTHFS